MPPEESRYTRDWLRVAEKDWGVAERYPLLDSSPLTLEEVSRSRDEVTGLVEFIRRECGK